MPIKTCELIQNGFQEDGFTPKMEPRFLRNTNGLEIITPQGGLIQHGYGDVSDNTLGVQRVLDTLTYIRGQVIKQVFYEVNLLDYGTIEYGEGAFMQSLLQLKEYSTADDFEAGNINQGGGNDRLAQADAATDSQTIQLRNWAKQCGWTYFELQQALAANNWDLISAKLRALAKNWQLGIQNTFFLGSKIDTNFSGLLNNPDYALNLTAITALISGKNAADFQTFVGTIIELFQSNCHYTTYPNRFIIPNDDWNGMPRATSDGFPINDKISYLENAFKKICGNDFRILPSAYAVPANNTAWGLNKHLYLLYKYNPDNGFMSVPVDMNTMAPGTLNNFQYQTVAYGQYSGYNVINPLQYLGFQF